MKTCQRVDRKESPLQLLRGEVGLFKNAVCWLVQNLSLTNCSLL